MALKKINYNGQSKIILRLCEMVNQLIDGGGGSGSTVTYTQTLQSGTKTGEISIDGVSTDMYAPTQPTKLSDLTNDEGFITSTVNNLTNYYKKSETYTQAEVDALISAIVTLNILVVQTLPTQDISTTTIYLVPKQTAETQDIYDEYIYVNNAWEHIGTTQIDLSNYYTKTETDALLANKVDIVAGKQLSTEDFTSALKTKLEGIASGAEVNVQSDWNQSDSTADDFIKNKPSIPTALSDLTDDSTHRLVTDTEKTTWNGKSDFSGSYNDLTDKPTIPTVNNGTLTIKKGSTTLGTFTANQSGNSEVVIPESPIDINTETPTFTEASTRTNIASGETISTLFGKIKKFFTDLKAVAFSGSYNDLDDTPTIPSLDDVKTLKNFYDTRPTSADIEFSNGRLFHFKATSTMTTGKPSFDGSILHMAWDNSSGYNAQLVIHNSNHGMQFRSQIGHTWGEWLTVATLSDIEEITRPSRASVSVLTYATTLSEGIHFYTTTSGTTDNPTTASSYAFIIYKASTGITVLAMRLANREVYVNASTNSTWSGWGTVALTSDIPSTFSDLGQGNAVIGNGTNYIQMRTNLDWSAGMYYETTGDEAMVFGNKNARTSWIFANTDPTDRAVWNTLSPAMHIKNGKVAIGKLIPNGQYLTYPLEVNGDASATNFRGNLIGTIGGASVDEVGNTVNTIVKRDSSGFSRSYGFRSDKSSDSVILAGSGVYCKDFNNSSYVACFASSFTNMSSKRYKENIKALTDEEAKKILDVETVTYDYKEEVVADDRHDKRGVIAEQVESIIPSVVTYEEIDGEVLPNGVDYSKFVPYLIKMVQIQQKEIEELKAIIGGTHETE